MEIRKPFCNVNQGGNIIMVNASRSRIATQNFFALTVQQQQCLRHQFVELKTRQTQFVV